MQPIAGRTTRTPLDADTWLEVSDASKTTSIVRHGLSVGTLQYIGNVIAGVHKVLVQYSTCKGLREFEVTSDVHEAYELIVGV